MDFLTNAGDAETTKPRIDSDIHLTTSNLPSSHPPSNLLWGYPPPQHPQVHYAASLQPNDPFRTGLPKNLSIPIANPDQPLGSNTTPASMAESSNTSHSNLSPQRHTRRKDATRSIVVANFSNETDALEILANAATDEDGNIVKPETKKVAWAMGDDLQPPHRLGDFPLIREGIISETTLESLVRSFFEHYHPTLPIFQTARIPRTHQHLADLAADDPFLLTTIVAVTSRHDPVTGMKDVHEQTWSVLREAIIEYAFSGAAISVGFVEGLLLLSEWLPREVVGAIKGSSVALLQGGGGDGVTGLHGTDNRRSWSLTGLAIRAAYGLGRESLLERSGRRCPHPRSRPPCRHSSSLNTRHAPCPANTQSTKSPSS